jgi:ATP/ADP translocase
MPRHSGLLIGNIERIRRYFLYNIFLTPLVLLVSYLLFLALLFRQGRQNSRTGTKSGESMVSLQTI